MHQRVAIVTGAAGDIGGAVATVLAARDWRLVLADHPDVGEQLEQSAAALGTDTFVTRFDVTDADAVVAGVAACVAAVGVPAAVFDGAGVQGPFAPVHHYPAADARRVIEVNVLGALNVLTATAAAMVEHGRGGAIVCSASMAGVTGAPNMAAYSASKAAVVAMVKAAAKDLAPAGIRVCSVSPAFIGPGRMWDAQIAAQAAAGSQYYATDPDEVAAQMLAMIPLRRYGSPHEVAEVVAFLLSDEASYVTGIDVQVAGGSA